MNLDRVFTRGTHHERSVPAQPGNRNLEQAAKTVEDWLETQAVDEIGLIDNADELRQVGVLARSGAPTEELNRAVRCARQHGWGWAPIALLLGESREQARQRLT